MELAIACLIAIVLILSAICVFFYRRGRYWKAVAKLNRDEIGSITLLAHEHQGHSFDKGYMLGLKNGVEAMYETAHRAGASDMVLVALNFKGTRLVGNIETVDTA